MSEPYHPKAFSRMDQSFLGAWWWTVDRALLAAILSLMILGVALVASASPAVAERIGAGGLHFLQKHLVFFVPSVFVVLGVSMFSPRIIWRAASILLLVMVVMLFFVLFAGSEIKGARRWIEIFGFSLQPSEFVKPSFTIVAARLISSHKGVSKALHEPSEKKRLLKNTLRPVFYSYHVAVMLYLFLITLLLAQPDLGMSVVLTLVFAVQIFLAGLRFRYLAILLTLGLVGLAIAYVSLSHVQSRVDRFFSPESGDNYQVENALDAIRQGGLLGAGPGQGVEKNTIPDAHADFIFPVLVEEMGVIISLLVLGLFLFVILRGFKRLRETQDIFCLLAAGGLLAMFGFQSLIHFGSSLNILPAKGMTLPFLSYGGSSLLSMALSMGMVLALTRQRRRDSIARSSMTMRRARPASISHSGENK
ncbi:MAG: FtsW/RodA/SpoVE family cell cycle protein [Alphaproteobacteria bacterium]